LGEPPRRGLEIAPLTCDPVLMSLPAHTLEVPGATLHVERRGSGPTLLLIAGGGGDCGSFERIAQLLSDRYTVLSYDRRGFSRSPLQGQVPSDGAARLAANVDDARAIIDAFGKRPAHVLGSSSGAIIALHLLVQHPEHVGILVAHEPPLVDLLPDAAGVHGFFREVFDTYRKSGVPDAMHKFLTGIGIQPGPRPQGAVPAEMLALFDRIQRNQAFFFEHELRQFPRLTPDLQALTARRSQLVLGVGRDSVGTLPYRPNLVLAERFGVGVSEFAGGHVGYVSHPTEFAARLAELLSARARSAP
jgi:pimeloyl-ACP methyl ester carboxylesterase